MLRSSVLLAVLACLPMAVACGKSGNADKQKKEEGESKAKTYYCPMHPDVTSDKPGTCSKCQMALKEKTKGDDSDSQANLRTYRCK